MCLVRGVVNGGVGVGSMGWGLSLSKCHTAAAGCQNWHCHDVTFVKLITFFVNLKSKSF